MNSFFGGGAIFILFYFSLFFRRFDLGIVRRGGGCFCIFFFKLKKSLAFFFGVLIFFARFVKS